MNTRSSRVNRSRRCANSRSSNTSFRQRGENGVRPSCSFSVSSSPNDVGDRIVLAQTIGGAVGAAHEQPVQHGEEHRPLQREFMPALSSEIGDHRAATGLLPQPLEYQRRSVRWTAILIAASLAAALSIMALAQTAPLSAPAAPIGRCLQILEALQRSQSPADGLDRPTASAFISCGCVAQHAIGVKLPKTASRTAKKYLKNFAVKMPHQTRATVGCCPQRREFIAGLAGTLASSDRIR
jgi:hypothetical protein